MFVKMMFVDHYSSVFMIYLVKTVFQELQATGTDRGNSNMTENKNTHNFYSLGASS